MIPRSVLISTMFIVGALSLVACSDIAVTDGLASDDVQLATGARSSDSVVLGTTALPEAQPEDADVSFVDASGGGEADTTIITLDDDPEADAADGDATTTDSAESDADAASTAAESTETAGDTTARDGLPGDPAVVPTGTWKPASDSTLADVFTLPDGTMVRTLGFDEVVRTTGRAQSLDGVLWAEITDAGGAVGWVAGELLIEAPDPDLSPTATAEPTATAAPTATPEPEATAESDAEPTATPVPDPTATPTPEPTATPDPTIVVLRELVVSYPGLVWVTEGTTELQIHLEPDPASEVIATATGNDEMIVAENGYFYEDPPVLIPFVKVAFGEIEGWTDGSFLEAR